MISEKQYQEAIKQKEETQKVINCFHKEKREAFEQRLKDNPVFTDEELIYSAYTLCPCGYGLAYPKECGGGHYWDCSSILKGIADKDVIHTDQLPFAFYSIKGENPGLGTTRNTFKPKENK